MTHPSRPSAAAAATAAGALAAAALLAACGNGSSAGSGAVTVAGDVPIAYAKRSTALRINPTDGTNSAPGGDLMLREKSSPSAPEHNLTARITQGQGDVADPEVSWDGRRIVFALRCPTTNTATVDGTPGGTPACTGRWNLWEYTVGSPNLAQGVLRRLTASTTDDDVEPAYLSAGRGYVFTSNRQGATRTVGADGEPAYALDEYERERVLNLHTMDAQGGSITQISVNQSHDRNPTVRPDGDILFSRWEHVGPRNRFAMFTVKPDGSAMFVKYGAHSPGNSFLHPRDMDPAGRYKGQVVTDLMPLSGTQEGGALMLVDIAGYSEQDTPANAGVPARGGQVSITAQPLEDGRGLSAYGRVTAPYPLWDGSDRMLVAWRPCEVTRNGQVVPCASLTQAERALLADTSLSRAERAAAPVRDDAPAAYGIYMVDTRDGVRTETQTWLNVASPPPGFMYVDPVAIQPRAEPSSAQPTSTDPALAAQRMGLIEVRSIYDTDGLGRMAEGMFAAADLPAGCERGIPLRAPTDLTDTRERIADLARLKNPADPAYRCTPVRFVRATRAVAPQAGTTGMRQAIGETDFEPQQILGYAPIEPDGSFKLRVPADTPLALAVLDSQGRAIQTHLNWIQVRAGERRTCDGCHSPRRGASINAGATVNDLPVALLPALRNAHQSGETLASLRTRLDPTRLELQRDLAFADGWADTGVAGVTALASIRVRYTGNADPADDLVTPAPANGLINYAQHIQPIWSRDRGANTCVACHADAARLDLRATLGGSGRLVSYDELLIGDPVIDPATGRPSVRLVDGVPQVQRQPALVETDAGGAGGLARMSRLVEILAGQRLKASDASLAAHPNPPPSAPDHARLLNAAERRLVTEWIDLGGQYMNDLSAPGGTARVTGLGQAAFQQTVQPVLAANCMACHSPGGSSGAAQGTRPVPTMRYVLTGSPEGDYHATLGMVTDVCGGARNPLVARPSTAPHPTGTALGAALPAGSAGHTAILAWIASGCR